MATLDAAHDWGCKPWELTEETGNLAKMVWIERWKTLRNARISAGIPEDE